MAGIRLVSMTLVALDARLALVLLILLLTAAAAPIVLAWMALLPAARDPFASPGESSSKKPRDDFFFCVVERARLFVNDNSMASAKTTGSERGRYRSKPQWPLKVAICDKTKVKSGPTLITTKRWRFLLVAEPRLPRRRRERRGYRNS